MVKYVMVSVETYEKIKKYNVDVEKAILELADVLEVMPKRRQ